ncbi:hypothetical protein [Paracraurococcus lichenis]|uniref:KTSC domain-containing protein n=1 Tax=Paracraurococcus lichenis TaxID=3064888 RepID=A0ABT9DYD0_9PROT|nr:hypothetical protein [Paracraurococcus sp. LOR1-02]MDO9708907.1 hypothetical protein [Paracraurococcus sp. LOR1-02]
MENPEVMIHVRFAPNGTVMEIGERPQTVAPQAWFDLLSEKASDSYRTYAGGRGSFSLPRAAVDALKGAAAA